MFVIFVTYTYIISTFKDNHATDTLLRKNISVESFQCRFTYTIFYDTVTANTEIEYTCFTIQCLGHSIGPTVLGISCCTTSIGNTITQDSNSILLITLCFKCCHGIPMVKFLLCLKSLFWRNHTLSDIRSCSRPTM